MECRGISTLTYSSGPVAGLSPIEDRGSSNAEDARVLVERAKAEIMVRRWINGDTTSAKHYSR